MIGWSLGGHYSSDRVGRFVNYGSHYSSDRVVTVKVKRHSSIIIYIKVKRH